MTKDQERSIDRFIKAAQDEMTPEAEAKRQELRGRRPKELQLWQQWKENGKQPELLQPLLSSLQPMIRSEANKRLQGLGGSIPRAAIENELRNSVVKSLNNYNPQKAALSTHVTTGFRRISDFVNANRNAKYVPGADMKRYDAFRNAAAEAHYELGRPPTVPELKDRLPGWGVNTIRKLQKSFGKELYSDLGDGVVAGDDSTPQMTPRDAFHHVRTQLSPVEVQFGQKFFPPEGEKQPSISNIAKALGIPTHRAYRIKANVETRVGKVLKGQ